MITRDFQGTPLPLLGLGCMRLPRIKIDGKSYINEELTEEMIRYALDHGVNYFDTAYFYHDGASEEVLGKILPKFPRDSYFLADKYPGHMLPNEEDPPSVIFEEQLAKCKTDHFDFYLLHNVCKSAMPIYMDEKRGVMEYFLKQKKEGRITHLGFSTHGSLEIMEEFLEKYGEHMEFCQIQLNYLDWTLQKAKEKVALLDRYGIPVWVMEPVRGGKLAKATPEAKKKLDAFRPDHSPAAWAFRFLQDIPSVKMILSGMSNMEQLVENIETFEGEKPLSEKERELLFDIAETIKNSVPCTACGYCLKDCPKGLEIPSLLSLYNEIQESKTFGHKIPEEEMKIGKSAEDCIACGKCAETCPQKIAIPETLKKLSELL